MNTSVYLSRWPYILLWCWVTLLPLHAENARPNILFIFTDDHAIRALGAYGDELTRLAPTPNLDRLATEGGLFRHHFVTNSICAPSRAAVLTGKHSHLNGQKTNKDVFDGEQQTFPKLLQQTGYTTGIIGKWHLKSDPTGFDHWMIYPDQGYYYNPSYRSANGKQTLKGYSVEVTTDLVLEFLSTHQDDEQPFLLMCQYKAPHRNWMPGPKYLDRFKDITFPEPDTLFDDFSGRSQASRKHKMGILEDMDLTYDLKVPGFKGRYAKWMARHLKRMSKDQRIAWDEAYAEENEAFLNAELSEENTLRWKYQRYLKDYLRCVAAVDDQVGRILDHLEETGIADNTLVVYSSDQGFYLGEHGWFDKRWMYEPSLRAPLLMRWPGRIPPGTRITNLTQNIDLAPTFLEAAGASIPKDIQGESMVPLFRGKNTDWRTSVYYQYHQKGSHGVATHYGVRDERYKLIYFDQLDEWELFDLENDPQEMTSLAHEPEHQPLRKKLESDLNTLRNYYLVP